jgi:hypothetical protein
MTALLTLKSRREAATRITAAPKQAARDACASELFPSSAANAAAGNGSARKLTLRGGKQRQQQHEGV